MPAKKITTAHKGRRCKVHECKRVLSIYNHNLYCHVHMSKMSGVLQGKNCEK